MHGKPNQKKSEKGENKKFTLGSSQWIATDIGGEFEGRLIRRTCWCWQNFDIRVTTSCKFFSFKFFMLNSLALFIVSICVFVVLLMKTCKWIRLEISNSQNETSKWPFPWTFKWNQMKKPERLVNRSQIVLRNSDKGEILQCNELAPKRVMNSAG